MVFMTAFIGFHHMTVEKYIAMEKPFNDLHGPCRVGIFQNPWLLRNADRYGHNLKMV